MSLYLQYHNTSKRGLKHLFSNSGWSGITTSRPFVKDASGAVLLVVGVGQPRRFYLWEQFKISEVTERSDGTFIAAGPGWQLNPPQQLDGPAFESFKSSCASFVGFRRIDDLPYSQTLLKLSKKHRAECSNPARREFLGELLGLLKKGTADFKIVAKELQGVGGSPLIERAIGNKNSVGSENNKPAKKLRALSIRQPHAEAIMRGVKKIEYRSRPTKIRGRFQIYAGQKRMSPEDEKYWMTKYGISDVSCDELPRGKIIGTAELWDCTEGDDEFRWHVRTPERAARLLKPKKQPQPVWFNPF